MSKETIELLKILKDETQSRSVFDRCEAEIASLKWTEPSPNAKAWNTTVAGRFSESTTEAKADDERLKAYLDAALFGIAFQKIKRDGSVEHIQAEDVYIIRDGEEVRIK